MNHEEEEDRTEEDVVGLDEVARPDRVPMVTQERRPRLPARVGVAYQRDVFLDHAFGDGDAELEQLAPDALARYTI